MVVPLSDAVTAVVAMRAQRRAPNETSTAEASCIEFDVWLVLLYLLQLFLHFFFSFPLLVNVLLDV